MHNNIIKQAIVNAGLTAAYVTLVASFLFYVPQQFAEGKPDTVLAPIMMLMLFVFSAGITSALVLGKPVLWYLDGKKREAVSLFLATLGALFAIIVLAFLVFVATSL